MRLARALLMWGSLPALVPCLLSLRAQTEPPKTSSAKPSHKLYRRFAVARGSWSAAAISLFNTWSAFDDPPKRQMSFYSPDGKKQIEVAGANVFLHPRGKTFDTGIDSLLKQDAELSSAAESTKY